MNAISSSVKPHFRLHATVEDRKVVFDLEAGTHRVGSRRDSDVCLPFAGVSREHAVLTVTSEGMTVEDRGSKNGVSVDGTQVTRAAVPRGSTLAFGAVPLSVERIDADDELAIQLTSHPSDPTRPFTPDVTATCEAVVVADEEDSSARSQLVFPDGYRPGTSPAMRALYRKMHPLTRGRLSVLIHGETGVGKEAVAHILHASSPRSSKPFVAVNCAAIPKELLEAEMFGVVKGAATGVDPRPGLFRQADGGTLFLDEVGEMPPALQPKLLRSLQDGEIRPLGGQSLAVDVRVLAATNAPSKPGDPEDAGGLREDLYYRLAGAVLEVPPLRRCREDIPGLAAHFLEQLAATEGIHPRGMTAGAVDRLRSYSWPGNVRELHQEMHRLLLSAGRGAILRATDLTEAVRTAVPDADEPPEEMDSLELAPRLEALEKAMLREAMLRTGGQLGKAADLLGLSRNGLSNKLKRFGLRHSWARDRGTAP